MVSKSILFVSTLLATTLVTLPQSQQPSKREEPALKLSTDLVTLDAVVLSKKSGLPVTGLRKEDFILNEEGVKQEISHFSYDSLPLSVVLLVDRSASVNTPLQEIQAASIQALKHLKPQDEVALMGFAPTAWLIQEFTSDRQQITDKMAVENGWINHMGPAPGWSTSQANGPTCIADGIHTAAEYLSKATNPIGRRVMIVITDNATECSHHSKKEVTDKLFESGAVVYGLKIRGIDDGVTGGIAKVALLTPFKQNGGNVNGYADETGGVVLDGRKQKAAEKLTEIINQLRQRYSIGYLPSNPQMDGRFRKIKLKVTPEVEKRVGGVVTLTRQGYYARRHDTTATPIAK